MLTPPPPLLCFCDGATADVFSNPNKKVEIGTPFAPVHLTHVGFNLDTGEFTVRPAFRSPLGVWS